MSKAARHRTVIVTSLLAAAAITLAADPAAALADSSTSSNWSGYAVHRSGVRFRSVVGTWRQPSATCSAGRTSYSAMWVGLGGFSVNSNALEQIGTEVDCGGSGALVSSAWYELVPAPSLPIRMTVRPGDLMSAGVTVVGHRVTLTLTDRSRHRSFSKTVNAAAIDVTSAEWILEAPSECLNNTQCVTLPLADFGSAHFAAVAAQITSGQTGTISSRLWGSTRITLAPSGRTFIAYGSAARATPTALRSGGSAFGVSNSRLTLAGARPSFAPRASATAARIALQPGGRRR